MIACHGYMDADLGVKVADFDGDGLLDIVSGRVLGARARRASEPRVFGRLFRNVGTPTAPRFEARDARGGAPYVERLQPADASGRTACARWTGTPTASSTCWRATPTASSGSSATSALARARLRPGVTLEADGRPIKV